MRESVPIIRPEVQSFLRFYLESEAAKRRKDAPFAVLEIGSGVGFSALWISEYAGAGARITTIEKEPARAARARENIFRFHREERITLLEGDAEELLPALAGKGGGVLDLVFMDAAKGQYPALLPDALYLLKRGGGLLSDNVLQGGDVMESRFAVKRRDRTIHARMREYLYALTHHEALKTLVLPIGDGLAVSTKI